MMSTVNVDIDKAEKLLAAARELTDMKEVGENQAADIKQKLASLAELPKVKLRLQDSKVAAAKSQVGKLDECITALKAWAGEALLSDTKLIGILDHLAEFASKAAPFGAAGATASEAAKAFDGKLPEVPEFVSKPFLVRCSLAFQPPFFWRQGWGWTTGHVSSYFNLSSIIISSYHESYLICLFCRGFFQSKEICGFPENLTTAFNSILTWAEQHYVTQAALAKLPVIDGSRLNTGALGLIGPFLEQCMAQCNTGLQAAKAVHESNAAESEKALGASLHQALSALVRMMRHLEGACTARCMQALVNDELKDADYKTFLPKHLHSTAHALQISWDKESEDLGGMTEVQQFMSKVAMMESAVATAQSGCLEDELFSGIRSKCKNFAQQFAELLGKAILSDSDRFLAPLLKLSEKYAEVEAAVESWTLKEVQWMFMEDTEKEVTDDVAKVKNYKKEAMDFVEILHEIATHKGAFSQMATISKAATEQMAKLKECWTIAGKLATFVVYTDLVVSVDDDQKHDLEKLEKWTQKHYGLGVQDMPKKLADQLEAIRKKKPAPGEAKGENPDNEKEKEKGKKRKSEGGEKVKKEKKEKTSKSKKTK